MTGQSNVGGSKGMVGYILMILKINMTQSLLVNDSILYLRNFSIHSSLVIQ